MRKTAIIILVLCVLGLHALGCESLAKKFIRPSKKQDTIPMFPSGQETPQYPNAVVYGNHYAYWKAWHLELANKVGQNKKKDIECVNAAISDLEAMVARLNEEKATELSAYVTQMNEIRAIIVKGLSYRDTCLVRSRLEQIRRYIEKNFYLNKVRSFIKPS